MAKTQMVVNIMLIFCFFQAVAQDYIIDIPENGKHSHIDAYGDEASLQEMPWVLNIPYRTDFTKRSSTELNTLISLLMKKLSPATQAGRPSSFRFGAGRK
ncbi:hypothetical protein CHS0354_029305 [Potamilus streckersoni]|uniref:Uncharacterized protein n=1 Tax=Potamilus streckersoni TaxID=2493646 RepID=A0AAE0W4S4_9BIVA|nr:hypothetical protein CHS0354_029305 [Potamilus streckersoni]